jgi:hypothetical protein
VVTLIASFGVFCRRALHAATVNANASDDCTTKKKKSVTRKRLGLLTSSFLSFTIAYQKLKLIYVLRGPNNLLMFRTTFA